MQFKIPFLVFFLFLLQIPLRGQILGLGLIEAKYKDLRVEHKIKRIKVLTSSEQKKGQFKYKLTSEADFNQAGQVLKYVWFIPSRIYPEQQDGQEISLFSYDEKGRIISFSKKSEFKDPERNHFYHHLSYAYDAHDKISKISYHRANGTVYRETANTSDSTQLMKFTTGKQKPGAGTKQTTQTTYDSLQNRHIYREYNAKNKLTFEKIIQLDQEKRITQIRKVIYPSKLVSITNIRYDFNGNEVERTETNKSGKIQNRYFNSFNEKGLLTQTSWTTLKDELVSLIKYEYEFY